MYVHVHSNYLASVPVDATRIDVTIIATVGYFVSCDYLVFYNQDPMHIGVFVVTTVSHVLITSLCISVFNCLI